MNKKNKMNMKVRMKSKKNMDNICIMMKKGSKYLSDLPS